MSTVPSIPNVPTHARAVIIGGGIAGCSVAYHLAKAGWTDIVLLEQGTLSCGTTWHAAGLVGQLRAQESMTKLIRYSTKLYSELEAETGLATGWTNCGSLSVARTPERMTQLKRTAAVARAYGVTCDVITAAEAGALWPVMQTADLLGGVWLPGDGKANPTDLTQALARGARNRGAKIVEGCRTTGIVVRDGAANGATAARGRGHRRPATQRRGRAGVGLLCARLFSQRRGGDRLAGLLRLDGRPRASRRRGAPCAAADRAAPRVAELARAAPSLRAGGATP